MMRLGIISELGSGENIGYARVSFDEVGIVSGWLALPSAATRSTKQWTSLEVNTQVACLMDDRCEQGVIVMALWSSVDMPPDWAGAETIGTQYADGTRIWYDAGAHRLTVDAPDAELTLTCRKLTVTGEVAITGDASVSGTLDASEVTAGDLLKVSLTGHKHNTLAVGSPTSEPLPIP